VLANSKKRRFRLSNVITISILLFAGHRLITTFLENSSLEGKIINSSEVVLYNDSTHTQFPPQSGKSVTLFWASWCGPCKVEMNRYKASVEEKKIPASSIFAINPFENEKEILKFIKENDYPFQFIGSENTKDMKVEATPTTLFLDGEKITSVSTGMSVIGIWRAEGLFKN
jgi:cytochrome c biogenesis protein CcmG/thiol:disulfide interchange protein DsbE